MEFKLLYMVRTLDLIEAKIMENSAYDLLKDSILSRPRVMGSLGEKET